jgi:translocator protein
MRVLIVRIGQFASSLAIPLAAGAVGSLFTTPAIPTWYAQLVKPFFTPPNWLFSPIWTALYILMGIALYLVWTRGWNDKYVQMAIAIFAMQLTLNVLWTFLFFGLHSPFLGLVGIALLWVAIILTIIAFFRVSAGAAILLVPYFVWVSFAAILNYAVFVLNP